jgi:hypothetical protein
LAERTDVLEELMTAIYLAGSLAVVLALSCVLAWLCWRER